MDLQTFTNPSGQLTKRGSAVHFVPSALPSSLTFSTRSINILSNADRVIGELNGLSGRIENPHLITRLFTRKEAVLSSRIEGTQTNFRELILYEVQQSQLFNGIEEATSNAQTDNKAPPRDAQDVMNYVLALDRGLAQLRDLPVSLRLVKNLHRILLAGSRDEGASPGEFRKLPVWIGPPGSSIMEARFVPAPPDALPSVLDDFEKTIHRTDELPPLVKIAMLHQYFETIHPFLDGNGRIGRLLIALLMNAMELLSQPLLYMSGYFEANRETYYDLLLNVSRTSDWMSWLEFFLTGVERQGRDAIQRARRMESLRQHYHGMVNGKRTPAGLGVTIDDLFATPITSITSIAKARGITYASAASYVKKLVSRGILHPLDPSRRRHRLYIAGGIMDAVEGASDSALL